MAARSPSSGTDFALTLPVRQSSIEEGRCALLGYVEPFDLDSRTVNRIEVILEELLSNVVRHAEKADRIELSATFSDSLLSICVTDNGDEFDPLAAQDPDPFSALEDAKLGGLGIPLIKRLSQSCGYDRSNDLNRIKVVIAAR